MQHQALVNIGGTGHVSHGKSTTVYKLTGKKTQQHSSEKETNNRTVKLGYANCKVFYNPANGTTITLPSSAESAKDPITGEKMQLISHLSFPDCPGHFEFMATMISGSKVMDSAMLVIAANQSVPQPQTYEHLLALKHSNIREITIIQNKLDLLTAEEAESNYQEILRWIETEPIFEDFTIRGIIPISAEFGYNLDLLKQHLAFNISRVDRDYDSPVKMTIVRSFNVNKPNCDITNLRGAVVGGTIHHGVLSVGDHIEINPGILSIDKCSGRPTLKPLYAKVLSLQGNTDEPMEHALPGGLVGVELSLDSGLATGDRLVGSQLAVVGHGDPSYNQITGQFEALIGDINPKAGQSYKMVSSGSMTTDLIVKSVRDTQVTAVTKVPIVASTGDKLALLSGGKLTATITVETGQLLVDRVMREIEWTKPPYIVINDLADVLPTETVDIDYRKACENIVYRDETNVGATVKIPNLAISCPTRHLIEIKNINDIISAIDQSTSRDSHQIDVKQVLLNFFKKELSDSCRYKNDMMLIDGGQRQKKLIKPIISNLMVKVFRCPSCRSSCKTVVYKSPGDNYYSRRCLNCPSVTTTKRLF